MRIARILAPIHALGPGERIGLWVQGCTKGCRGCISPEMQPCQGKEIEPFVLAKMLVELARKCHCTGLTISGGDPFEQAQDLLEVLRQVRDGFEDILVYTGFTREELLSGKAGAQAEPALSFVDVLIDGRYIEELNTGDCVLKGSANQKMLFLNPQAEEAYKAYMKKGRILETFTHDRTQLIIGIMDREEEV